MVVMIGMRLFVCVNLVVGLVDDRNFMSFIVVFLCLLFFVIF